MDDKRQELVVLYQQMADLTLPKCGQCMIPYNCCSPEYCEIAISFAEKKGIELQRTGHPKLPLMGSHGCTAPPHLRGMCTMHVCSINSLGFDPKDPAWTEHYFELRDKIERLEFELWDDD